jgi:mRNA interferase RelE/StbE
VSYSIDWYEAAVNSAAKYIVDDPSGLDELFDALDRLSEEPRPRKSKPLTTPNLRRLRVGRYRALYEIVDPVGSIIVIHLGRVGP